MSLDELLVVPFLVDDGAYHALDDRSVRAGMHGQPRIGLRCGATETRIKHCDVRAGFLRIHQRARPHDAAFQRIVPHLDNGRSIREFPDGTRRTVAERAKSGRLAVRLASVEAPFAALIGFQQRADEIEADGSLGGLADEHRIRPVLPMRLVDGIGDGLDSLVPADLLELAFAALADAPERRLQTIA